MPIQQNCFSQSVKRQTNEPVSTDLAVPDSARGTQTKAGGSELHTVRSGGKSPEPVLCTKPEGFNLKTARKAFHTMTHLLLKQRQKYSQDCGRISNKSAILCLRFKNDPFQFSTITVL